MDRAMIHQRLREAEDHILHCAALIARQRQVIAELQRDGCDVIRAMILLATFEATQRVHIDARDQALDELRSAR
jgi:hypothetical protein